MEDVPDHDGGGRALLSRRGATYDAVNDYRIGGSNSGARLFESGSRAGRYRSYASPGWRAPLARIDAKRQLIVARTALYPSPRRWRMSCSRR